MDDWKSEKENNEDRMDILRTLDAHWRAILGMTAVVAGAVLIGGGLYYFWLQPSVRTVVLEFRPTFEGAAEGLYPNGLPFSPRDVTAPAVMDQVFGANGIEQYCARDAFKSAFFVVQQSPEYAFLDAEFEARLADTRLTAVDRDRIQAEYASRRSALPLHYTLVFAPSNECRAIPGALVVKSLSDVLGVWAEQSDARRGVLKMHVQILTPNVLNVGLRNQGAALVRADLIRTALLRLVSNVMAVEEMPGASLIRLGDEKATFAEVRGTFEDLIQSRLEPLVVLAGRGLGAESLSWVDEALAAAVQEREVAQGRADTFLNGLREYSGTPQDSAATSAPPQQSGGGDVQTLTPQIDRTFIDRILEMSEANTMFRQEMTREMVEAGVAAVQSRGKVRYYEHLAAALRRPQGGGFSSAEVDARLDQIVEAGKALAQQFNDLYDEWSAISLRAAAAMYQTNKPARVEISRPFTRTSFVLMVVGAFVVSLLLLVSFFLGKEQLQRIRLRRA